MSAPLTSMEPSSPPQPSSYNPPPSSDKKSNQSNLNPHGWISIFGFIVCWWNPSSPSIPTIFLIILITSSTFFISFSAASDSATTPSASPPTRVINQITQNQSSGLNTTLIIVSVSAAAVVLLLALFFMAWFGCFRLRIRTRKNRVVSDDVESETGLSGEVGVRRLSWEEVQICTNGFEKVIDSGGFSIVYYGTLPIKHPLSAVRAFKVHNSSERLNQEFKEELRILLKLDHPNIVKLHAYCDDQDRGALVFEYVPGGTLRENLHSSDGAEHLPWRKRVSIACQLALALEYLHELCVVHGDIKSSNILLDSKFNVKLCDFGSAKMGFSAALAPPYPSRKNLITGSPGYVDPHYLRTGISSKKNDIYSFGVVLMELVTGLEPFSNETGRVFDSGHVRPDLVDHRLVGEYVLEEARAMGEIAAMCVRGSPSLRPSAREVITMMRQNVGTSAGVGETYTTN